VNIYIYIYINKYSFDELDVQVNFRKYRRDLADTLIYAHYIIRDRVLDILVSSLNRDLQQVSTTAAGEYSCSVPWQKIESSLFCIRSIAEVVQKEEEVYLPHVMQLIYERVPRTVPRLVLIGITLLGTSLHIKLLIDFYWYCGDLCEKKARFMFDSL
jgi:hypothetical protein